MAWEYKILKLGTGSWNDHNQKINELGEQDWECFAVEPGGRPILLNTEVVYFFKRWVMDD